MTGRRPVGTVWATVALLGTAAAAIHLALLPLGFAAERGPFPDLVLCLACLFAVRRPEAIPLWVALGLGLGADLMLSRPLGIGALGLLLAVEALRANAALLRSGPFVMEWASVAALSAAIALGTHAALGIAFAPGPGLAALFGVAAATALAYPLVVGVVALPLGLRAERAGRAR